MSAAERSGVGDALDPFEAGGDEFIGAILDPLGGRGVGRAAVGRVVLEAAVLGWVVRGRDDDAVGAVELQVAIAGKDGVREDRRRGVAEVLVDHDLDVVGGEDLERGREGWLGEGMGIAREKEWTQCVFGSPVFDDGLGDGGDVVVIECRRERAAAMAGGPETDALSGNLRFGMERIVRSDQAWHIDK